MTLDYPAFQAWLDGYIAAWKSYDPVAIGALFSEGATYRYHPEDAPVVGRAAIVAEWLQDRDAAGTYDARYEPLAIDGDAHVAVGWSRYTETPGGAVRTSTATSTSSASMPPARPRTSRSGTCRVACTRNVPVSRLSPRPSRRRVSRASPDR